jgi:heat shock 70kDa protein 1/2/6/8
MSNQKEYFNGCIGIDLGTTFSCVAVWMEDHVEVITNDLGNRTTPSWISFVDNEILVGELAKQQASDNPQSTIYDIKRIIGKQFHDEVLQNDMNSYTFKIIPDEQDRPLIEAQLNNVKKIFKPEELSAMVLSKMKSIAEDYLGKKVRDAVITVPAYFNDIQRTATKNSAQIAGLNCLRIINEPTSACLCYGLQDRKNCNVLIFDLGGGTLDVSVLEINGGMFEVRATNGNTHLGGEDFDNRLMNHLRHMFENQHSLHIPNDAHKSLRKLKSLAEITKNRLSQLKTVRVDMDSLYDGKDFHCQVSRETFQSLCEDLFESCLEPIKQVLEDSEMEKKDIDEIVLIGGATRIPKVQETLGHFFDGKKLNKSINPDEAVAYGASIQGAILSKNDTSGKTKDLLLVDVIPLSLGIETTGGIMSTIIHRNSTIPCEKSSMFSTVEDNQSTVLIQVYEGERRFTKDNHILGTFELTGIPKSSRGVPKIEVSFKIDANGILSVTAFEKAHQISQTVTITKDSGRLTEEEIQKMINDAELYRGIDEVKKDILEYRNLFEKYLQTSQRTINNEQFYDSLTIEERSYANQIILGAFDWLNAIEPETKELCNRSKEELIDCKQSVEFNLNPYINKVYTRQLPKENSNSQKNDTITTEKQLNQLLSQIDTQVNLPKKIAIKLKKHSLSQIDKQVNPPKKSP